MIHNNGCPLSNIRKGAHITDPCCPTFLTPFCLGGAKNGAVCWLVDRIVPYNVTEAKTKTCLKPLWIEVSDFSIFAQRMFAWNNAAWSYLVVQTFFAIVGEEKVQRELDVAGTTLILHPASHVRVQQAVEMQGRSGLTVPQDQTRPLSENTALAKTYLPCG